jgi:hypothetical protein
MEIDSAMNLVLAFVFLLCLLLLVMIFGEQLSVLGAFHGRWFTTMAESLADLWDFVCEAVDRAWSFVLKHLWWVLAVGSGSVGVLLVAWMMFGGIVDQAAADIAGHSGLMHVGGILDHVPNLDAKQSVQQISFARTDESIARLIHQVPSPLSQRRTPEFDWPPIRHEVAENDFSTFPYFPRRRTPEFEEWDRPRRTDDRLLPLEPELRSRSHRDSMDYSQWTWEQYENEFSNDEGAVTETIGRSVVAGTLKDNITFALRQLDRERSGDWKESDRFSNRDRRASDVESAGFPVREATYDELAAVESGIGIVPEAEVTESDLRIEKRTLAVPGQDAVDIEISVTNRSRRYQMSGLLIREQLPYELRPLSIDSGGVYLDSTVTWVIDGLQPQKNQIVRMRVRSDSNREVETQTEISATAAVISQIRVQSDRRTDFVPGHSKITLVTGNVPQTANLSETIAIPFRLSNVGSATAEEVILKITLPEGLDHFRLTEKDIDRDVDVTIRNLKAGATRDVTLRVLTKIAGDQTAIVALLEDGDELRIDTFSIFVQEAEADPFDRGPLLPKPENGRRR